MTLFVGDQVVLSPNGVTARVIEDHGFTKSVKSLGDKRYTSIYVDHGVTVLPEEDDLKGVTVISYLAGEIGIKVSHESITEYWELR